MKPWIKRLNNHIYYGWMIVFLSALTFFMSSPGQTYSISIFNNIYKDTFSLSSTEISTAYSLATVLSGVLLVFMGRAVDRFGARRMSLFVGVMLALTTFFNSYVTGLWMMFAGFFFLRYFGQGSMTLIPSALVPSGLRRNGHLP
ncbi:MAG: MFS transporter [Acholeplasmataceae bacterium]|nr:MFS transporter [Acholeplasmataceae bacterium]